MQGRWAHLENYYISLEERDGERGHILCLPWRACKVVKIMCKMSLNPLKPRFLFPFPFCCSFALLILRCRFASCWIISTASLFSNYGTIFIPFFFTPFPSLSLCLFFPLFLSVLRRFSLNCFRCLRYLAPLFRLYLPPPPCNTSIFVLLFFFSLSSLFFAGLWCQSKQFLPLAFFAVDFSFWV